MTAATRPAECMSAEPPRHRLCCGVITLQQLETRPGNPERRVTATATFIAVTGGFRHRTARTGGVMRRRLSSGAYALALGLTVAAGIAAMPELAWADGRSYTFTKLMVPGSTSTHA